MDLIENDVSRRSDRRGKEGRQTDDGCAQWGDATRSPSHCLRPVIRFGREFPFWDGVVRPHTDNLKILPGIAISRPFTNDKVNTFADQGNSICR